MSIHNHIKNNRSEDKMSKGMSKATRRIEELGRSLHRILSIIPDNVENIDQVCAAQIKHEAQSSLESSDTQ